MLIGNCYKIIKKVGSGAFGEIFKGIHFLFNGNQNLSIIGVNTQTN
jgi:serine/threonine protein kinase